MKKNRCYKKYIGVFCMILLPLLGTAQVQKGRINYDLKGKVKLAGEWEFYWDTLFTQKQENQAPVNYIKIPGLWKDYEYSTTGVAVYRVTILSPKNCTEIGALIPEVHSAYKLYLNGQLVAKNGEVSLEPTKCIPKWIPQMVHLNLHKGENELIMQVANYQHSRGGTYKNIVIGKFNDIQSHRELQVAIDVFLIGSLVIISLFFLGIHFFWRKEPVVLFFALTALTYALRTSIYDIHLLNKLLSNVSWGIMIRIEYLSTYGTFLFFNLLIKNLYPEDFNPKISKSFNIFFLLAIGIVSFTPPYIFTQIMVYGLLGVFLLTLYAIVIFIKAYIKKRTGAVFTMLVVVMLFSVPLLSMAFYFNIIPYIPFVENISSMIIILSFSFVMAVRFSRSFKETEYLRDQTLQQNKIISHNLEEKELLLAEIHHRVKNNLQIINSILFLQSRSIKDEQAILAIQETQYRVQSMALVHQQLYQGVDHGLGVSLPDYFRDLIASVSDSYSSEGQIKYELDIAPIIMELDSVIPLGLIVNELIINSNKHAFSNIENPTIRIECHISEHKLLQLSVKDNGQGINSTSNGFGTKLIKSLSRKLKGEQEVITNKRGTNTSFTFHRFKIIK